MKNKSGFPKRKYTKRAVPAQIETTETPTIGQLWMADERTGRIFAIGEPGPYNVLLVISKNFNLVSDWHDFKLRMTVTTKAEGK